MSPPRAVIVVTGSELVRGAIRDANGPFLARELTALGLEPARILTVGDRPEELEAALREGTEADLCVISGGLGPTHDDRTVELLAGATGASSSSTRRFERRSRACRAGVAERLGRPFADFANGIAKQATLPDGAVSLGLAGTAPAVLLEHDGRVAVALPGPPGELRRLWPNVLAHEVRCSPPERVPARSTGSCASSDPPNPPWRGRSPRRGRGRRPRADRLRARPRDPGRPLPAGRRRGARGRGRARAPSPLRGRPLRRGRAAGARARARPPAGRRADARDGGVVHGRARGGALTGSRRLRRLSGRRRRLRERGEAARSSACPRRHPRQSTGRSRPRPPRRWPTGARDALGADVAVAVTGIAGPEADTGRSRSASSSCTSSLRSGAEAARASTVPGDRDAIRSRAAASVLSPRAATLDTVRDTFARICALAWWAMSDSASSARSPLPGAVERLVAWQDGLTLPAQRIRRVPRREPPRHARVPRRRRRATAWTTSPGARSRRRRARSDRAFTAAGYRETRSVGMVVLADEGGRATALADELAGRLEALGVYRPERRPWLAHVTVLRFRDRPRLRPSARPRTRQSVRGDSSPCPFCDRRGRSTRTSNRLR